MIHDLEPLRRQTRAATQGFLDTHAGDLEAYRVEVSRGMQEALARLQADVREITADNPVCDQLVGQLGEYVSWLQWSLWDLPYFAVAQRPTAERFRSAVAACGLVYLSIRVFDDVIDRHFSYKGKHPTLLSAAGQIRADGRGVEGLTLLGGLLLCFEGLSRLVDPAHADLTRLLDPVVRSVRRAVIGAVMEHSGPETWTRPYYDRLVQLKNVDYWRGLYTALDPERASPLYPFLELYYTLAQHLNDVQDFPEDQRRGQPNLVSLSLPAGDGPAVGRSANGTVPGDVEEFLAQKFLELGRIADRLPPTERSIAQLKLGEALETSYRLGLFADRGPAAGGTAPAAAARLGLHWLSGVGEVIERAGGEALVKVQCAVCGGADRHFLFRKQGFAFHRCAECAHIYVSPRISAELQSQIAEELDGTDAEDAYLAVQKMYAQPICHVLRARAPGPRLLDIGFGHGYLMQIAQAYGFEVYGADSSAAQVDRLRPHFGHHLHRALMGADEIPWDAFDVVVMSHVLEHLADPAAMLGRLRQIMNPRALLYLAVPDLDSLQFRIFGKRWDVINPIVHFQYFTEASLSRLLRSSGFVAVERIEHPPVPAVVAARWMHLMRRLGGGDSGELAMLARVPGGAECG